MIARRTPRAQGDLSTSFGSRGSLIHESSTTVVHDGRVAGVAREAEEPLACGRAYPMLRLNPQIGQLAEPERGSSSRCVVQPFVPQ